MDNVAVTGSAGYVGSLLVRCLRNVGARVIELRRMADPGEPGVRRFRLEEDPAPAIFSGLDALVHCAYDFKAWGWDEIREVNVEGTRRLFSAASRSGVRRFVLISTISAFPGCNSLYGRAKLEMEAIAAEYGAVIIRPGLVFGQRPGGMVGSLMKLVSLPGLVPLVGDGRCLLCLAHEDDLCRLVVRAVAQPAVLGATPIVAAHDRPYTLREIMSALGKARGKRLHFLPMPSALIDFGLRIVEGMGFRPRLRRDSLRSLLNQDPAPNFAPLKNLGLDFRPFP